ncbi:MAG: nucleotidyl transferase AbiEii/AbiGii toxin family protein [Minisyncoccia bacterium]
MHKEILTEEQNKLLTLAAMKAFALGRRNKWKDYVDLYFIIKDRFSVNKIAKKAAELFAGEFNERIFRNQLAYFDDMNYSEPVEFMPGFEVADEIIKQKLIDFSLE